MISDFLPVLEMNLSQNQNSADPEAIPEWKGMKKQFQRRRTTNAKLTSDKIRSGSKVNGAFGLRVAYLGGFLDRRSRDWRLDAGPEERRWVAFFGMSRLEELPLDIQNSIHQVFYMGSPHETDFKAR